MNFAEAFDLPPIVGPDLDSMPRPPELRKEGRLTKIVDDILLGVGQVRAVLQDPDRSLEARQDIKRQSKYLHPPVINLNRYSDPYEAAELWRSAFRETLSREELKKAGLIVGENERTDDPYPVWSFQEQIWLTDFVTITRVIDTRTLTVEEGYSDLSDQPEEGVPELQEQPEPKPHELAVVQFFVCYEDGTPKDWKPLLWFSFKRAVGAFNRRSKDRP